jgi:hypothetical protein
MYFHMSRETMSFLTAQLLRDKVAGFEVGRRTLLDVYYVEADKSVYHQYEGGSIWMATTPLDIGRPGQTLSTIPALLTTNEFIANMPPIRMTNEVGFSWLPEASVINRFSHSGVFGVEAEQDPPVEGVKEFSLALKLRNLDFAPGLGCYLEAGIVDYFGRERRVRFYHDGHSTAWIGLHRGKRYPRISLLSYDGVRLRIAYGSPEVRVASIYLDDPSSLYSLQQVEEEQFHATRSSGWRPSRLFSVKINRVLEREMLRSRYRYPHGKLGSEIAYSIPSRELGFENLILNDPSEGGADMMTNDGGVVFESRLVTITGAMKIGRASCRERV